MIVKFKDTFHVPGFGRSRFTRGVVYDVPESLRGHLPKSAVVLPDDYGDETSKAADDLAAADFARAQAEAADNAALEKAGLGGYEVEDNNDLDTSDELDKAVEEVKKKSSRNKKGK
jgi:hypothetical protein